MKVLITGAGGMLGRDLTAVYRDQDLLLPGEEELDITREAEVRKYLRNMKPQLIINCAAFTNVDACEEGENREKVMAVNGLGPGYLAAGAEELQIPLVHISTDYVFAGDKDGFYEVDDPPGPLNQYGESKLLGEREVRKNCTRAYILRTSWLFGKGGPNFVRTMLRFEKEGKDLKVVADQIGSPTYTRDLAFAIRSLVQEAPYGTYHVTNDKVCSWYEFAQEIFRQAGIPAKVQPVPSSEYIRPARRPLNSRLSSKSLTQAGIPLLRPWQEALGDYLREEAGYEG